MWAMCFADRVNLRIVPGFTMASFTIILMAQLIGTAFEPETCVTNISSIEKHCATAPHYYVDTDYHGRPLHEKRYVQDADCLLWSWLPIVLVMFVMMHIFWALLMKSQDIDFDKVVDAANSVRKYKADESGRWMMVDEAELSNRLPVIAEEFRRATTSNAATAYLVFKLALFIAPLLLLFCVLPFMIDSQYATWGISVLFANVNDSRAPLFPQKTYCDFPHPSADNRLIMVGCYLYGFRQYKTVAFCIWWGLALLSVSNFVNLLTKSYWAWKMSNGGRRQQYVLDHWIWTGSKKIPPSGAAAFAATFTMDNLLLFDFIADNADWIAANAICMELFKNWQDESRPSRSSNTRISTDIPMNRLGL